MSLGRIAFGVCTKGTEIIVCGGVSSQMQTTDSCERYTTTSNEWTVLPRLNQAKQSVSLVAAAGKVYCFGGLSAQMDYLEEIEVLSDDTWQVMIIRMPLPVYDCGAFSIGDSIVICGGITEKTGIADTCYLL